jgi:hypothetical protein
MPLRRARAIVKSKPPLRVAALRCNSLEIVDGERPS